MRAARWHRRNDVRVEEISEPPPPPPGQVQVEIAWCGICGTGLHELTVGPLYIPVDSLHPLTGVLAPIVLGHEVSGRVVAVGEGVKGLAAEEKTVVGSMGGYGMYERAIEMMADPRFRGEEMVTGRVLPEDIVERGFHPLPGGDDASTRERQQVKIPVSPSGRVD